MNAAARKMTNTVSNEAAYPFEYTGHCVSGFKKMHNFYQRKMFCDVTVMVGREEFLAHQVVLAAVSPYFEDLLQGEDQSEANRVVEIDLEATSPLSFQLVLEYIYSGKITINSRNIQDLIVISKLLRIASLEAACGDAIQVLLTPANCFMLKTVAGAQCSEEVYEKCLAYALQHFTVIVETEEFLQLTVDEVKELIADREVSVVSEEEKYSAVLKWVKHDLLDRKENLFELMQAVELPLMDHTFFMENVVMENLLRLDVECMSLVLDNTKYHVGTQAGSASSSRSDPRKHSKSELLTYIFATGGGIGGAAAMSECEVYNSKTNTWHAIASMQSKRRGHAVIGFGQRLYAFGGLDGPSTLSSVECYDPIKNAWIWTTPLPHERCHHAICSLNDAIFICGGRNKNGDILSTVEQFDVSTARYKTCAAMNTKRTTFKTAATGGCIYAIGGWNGPELNSVERFDPREGRWSPAPSMRTARHWHGVTVLNDYIYCTGGYGTRTSGERFDTRGNVWDPIPDMLNGRSGHELVTLDGCVYAIGGYQLNSVEKFDPNTNQWIKMPSMLNKRWTLGASVLDCLEIKHL